MANRAAICVKGHHCSRLLTLCPVSAPQVCQSKSQVFTRCKMERSSVEIHDKAFTFKCCLYETMIVTVQSLKPLSNWVNISVFTPERGSHSLTDSATDTTLFFFSIWLFNVVSFSFIYKIIKQMCFAVEDRAKISRWKWLKSKMKNVFVFLQFKKYIYYQNHFIGQVCEECDSRFTLLSFVHTGYYQI